MDEWMMNIRREERKVICIHRYEKKKTENANSQYWKALGFQKRNNYYLL